MEGECRKKVEEWEKNHSEAMRKSQAHFQDLLTAANATQAKGMESIMGSHQRELDRIMKVHDDQMDSLKKDRDENRQQLIDMRNEMKAKEQELQKDFNAILDTERAKLTSAAHKYAELDGKLQRARSDLDIAKSQQIEAEEVHTKQIKSLRADFDQKKEADKSIWMNETEKTLTLALQKQAEELQTAHLSAGERKQEKQKDEGDRNRG